MAGGERRLTRQYFDFTSLIADYADDFFVVTHAGSGYDEAGDWLEGQEERVKYTGAIIAYRESKIMRAEGAISTKDRRLFMHAPLPDAMIGAYVLYGGQKYHVDSETENAEFTGVYSYHLKWVSAFDDGKGVKNDTA